MNPNLDIHSLVQNRHSQVMSVIVEQLTITKNTTQNDSNDHIIMGVAIANPIVPAIDKNASLVTGQVIHSTDLSMYIPT
jgi:hypothetical protein